MIFDIPVLRYTAYRIYFQKKNQKKTQPKNPTQAKTQNSKVS